LGLAFLLLWGWLPSWAAKASTGGLSTATAPDAVELEFFIGTANYPVDVLLEWATVSETNTSRFRIYRGTVNDWSVAENIHEEDAQSPGGGGNYYSYHDSYNLVPGTVYYYWIAGANLNGEWPPPDTDPEYVPVVPWGDCSAYDVVCNFVIDAQDLTAIAERWTCSQGEVCYEATLDLNADLIIDVLDIMEDGGRWGCTWGQACYSDP
jgi:hypothetical protein